MSLYGARWKFDGVAAAFVTRGGGSGQYRVVFEREYAELPAIEAINWSQPVMEALTDAEELGLPEGYGFQVEGITYDSGSRSYTVILQTDRQYWGDVTGYQAQIAELQAQTAEAQRQAEAAEASLTAREHALAAAYMEGVECYG